METRQDIVIVAHNIRSAHNIGSLFRTADGFGVSKIVLSGYSAIPFREGSLYKNKSQKEIEKTALGAQDSILWEYQTTVLSVIKRFRNEGYFIVALEKSPKSIPFYTKELRKKQRLAIFLGNEVSGVEDNVLQKMDAICEIPMMGKKNSFNVTVSCGIFLGTLRYFEARS